MNQITAARARVEAAAGLAATLDAAYIAFETILAALRRHQERSGPGFPAFVLAAAAAGNGRDWIAEAATLPPASTSPGAADDLSGGEDWLQAAAEIAAFGRALADHLEAAAADAVDPRDQAACRRSMSYAERISSLLAGARQT
jgi:hypothetical protein